MNGEGTQYVRDHWLHSFYVMTGEACEEGFAPGSDHKRLSRPLRLGSCGPGSWAID